MKLYLIFSLFLIFICSVLADINEEPAFDENKIIDEKTQNGTPEKKDCSKTIYCGLAVTTIAFAFFVGVGYKNFRKDKVDINNKENINENNSVKRNSTVIQMETILTESNNTIKCSTLTKNRAYKCIVAWDPQQQDEIILHRGDLVCVRECYDDGYTLGRNLSTKFDGVFPTCCLAQSGQKTVENNEFIKNGKFISIPKRVSSKQNPIKHAKRASRGISIIPNWTKAAELNALLEKQ